MSNKTQLQTNNASLDALISRVNAAKDTAASLPDAGGGGSGGGGGVEDISGVITYEMVDPMYEPGAALYKLHFDPEIQPSKCIVLDITSAYTQLNVDSGTTTNGFYGHYHFRTSLSTNMVSIRQSVDPDTFLTGFFKWDTKEFIGTIYETMTIASGVKELTLTGISYTGIALK